MRPWMLRELERERMKIRREREQREVQRLALHASEPQPTGQWSARKRELAEDQSLALRRGVWVTDI